MNELAIVSIIKNEGLYLQEWIQFHVQQGVQKFYLYNNNSTDDTLVKLKPAIRRGVVVVKHWPFIPGQMAAYKDALIHHKQWRWLAFIDADEFLFGVNKPLIDAVKDYEAYDGIAVHWMLYGPNGETHYKPDPVTWRFKRRDEDVNPHVKSIVRPSACEAGKDPHSFKFNPGAVCVDENKNILGPDYSISLEGTADILRINHYHTKSRSEARERWKQKRADNNKLREFATTFEAHSRGNTLDDIAWRIYDSGNAYYTNRK